MLTEDKGHGYLEALASHNVTTRNDVIEAVAPEGLKMADGTIVVIDALICATGFDTSYRPNFPVVGLNGDLRDIWQDEPKAYFSIAAAGLPNYFGQYKVPLFCIQWPTCDTF